MITHSQTFHQYGVEFNKKPIIFIQIKLQMSNINRISTNTPWNLNQHTINKSDINFYVKLVHVDRYGCPVYCKNPGRTHSVSYKRREEIQGEKIVQQSKPSNLIIPSKIISEIPLWNHRRQTSTIHQKRKQPLTFMKSKSGYKNNSSRLKKIQKQSPNKKRSQTEYFEQKINQMKNQQNADFTVNKTLSIEFSFKSRIKTEPDERQLTNYNNTSVIEKSLKSKRETIKQVLFFKHEKAIKRKQYIMKKFKTTLNKAKFSNSLITKETH